MQMDPKMDGAHPEAGAPNFFGWVTRMVHVHRARLVRVVQHEGLGAEDAFDCVQDAFHNFLALPQARMLVEDPDDSAKLLTVLARNLARNRRRRHDRARPHTSDPIVLDALKTDLPTPDEVVMQAEKYTLMVGCVATLSQIQHAVVNLRLVDEVPGEDVAALLGISQGHVAVLLHRAKKKLQACIDQESASP